MSTLGLVEAGLGSIDLDVGIKRLLFENRGRWYCDSCVRALTGVEPFLKPVPGEYQRACDMQCTHCRGYRRCTRARPSGKRASPRRP